MTHRHYTSILLNTFRIISKESLMTIKNHLGKYISFELELKRDIQESDTESSSQYTWEIYRPRKNMPSTIRYVLLLLKQLAKKLFKYYITLIGLLFPIKLHSFL